MGNFDFVKTEWPQIHEPCARAESYVASDPRAACFYARRAVELLVTYLYDLKGYPTPYRDDLSARINAPEFTAGTGPKVAAKLNYLRKLGNDAVHQDRTIGPRDALGALKELFHVMISAAFFNFAHPDNVPTGRQFDPQLARRAAPLTAEEVQRLAQKFQEQDRKHREELERSRQEMAEKDAVIARLREEIAAGQAAKTVKDDHDYREEETRDRFIDLLLREAGWPLDDPRDREYPVTGMPTSSGRGRVDYVLWGSNGLPLAVVEAKRTRRSAEAGRDQARYYADALERETGQRPLIFYTNGQDHHLWDDAMGYPPRPISGFLTEDELGRLIARRRTRTPLSEEPINTGTAGRDYQQRAIRAVDAAFDAKRREALLVMATGTGKTRTVIALVEQLTKAHWAKNVLFLADRTALVEQAEEAFAKNLPDSGGIVNLLESRSGAGRIYLSTYPTILNLIQQKDDTGRRFGPGYFDLIIVDEAHRSVYDKYREIFEYFDAYLIGLTATPKEEVDRNTYELFGQEEGVPTDAYTLDEAIADGWLVPPQSVSFEGQYLRRGIRYADLTEDEKAEWDALEWDENGEIPDAVSAEQVNKILFNAPTVDNVLTTLMEQGRKVADGDRLGKTIIFAKSQRHAEFILERFEKLWPELGGRFAQVITHHSYAPRQAIKDFIVKDSTPHLAISVDMLDTGIDAPAVVNLVFFKDVHSPTKFWQMIGRGTRPCEDLYGPGQDKEDFFVFDFCGNLEYFNQQMEATQGSTQPSMSTRLFLTRAQILQALDVDAPDADARAGAADTRAVHADWLHRTVAGMNLENPLVRRHRFAVEKYSDAASWHRLDTAAVEELEPLAQLPTAVTDPDVDAKRFDILLLRGQLARLTADESTWESVALTVQEIAGKLEELFRIDAVRRHAELIQELTTEEWWQDATVAMLEQTRTTLRGVVRLIAKTRRNPVYTDFVDTLGTATPVELRQVTPGLNAKRFKEKATAYLREHEDDIALQKLRRGRQLTPSDLESLERMLVQAGGGAEDIERAKQTDGGLGVFIRSLVGLERAAVMEKFTEFLDEGRNSADQIRFVRMIVDELVERGVMEPGRLFEDPYTAKSSKGPELYFPPERVIQLADRLREVNLRARVPEAS
ncbi:DEAD/DEAH box helicase family protein [Rothia kristinae]|uniref:Restriction endonuclease subunit R n=1 Tax=Rothia kristinae TaxID=37923 RepID=A0A199NQH5_9MICC|nr:DEAD/DEAH box helicase family protein [Rothia kristinae]OAX51182.1 restriction endonuclease subunit R [Rothia kristinae]